MVFSHKSVLMHSSLSRIPLPRILRFAAHRRSGLRRQSPLPLISHTSLKLSLAHTSPSTNVSPHASRFTAALSAGGTANTFFCERIGAVRRSTSRGNSKHRQTAPAKHRPGVKLSSTSRQFNSYGNHLIFHVSGLAAYSKTETLTSLMGRRIRAKVECGESRVSQGSAVDG